MHVIFGLPAHSDVADGHATQGEKVGHHKNGHIVTNS